MRRVDRYLFREFLQAFLVGLVTAVLLVIALRYQNAVAQLARDKAPLSSLLLPILYDLPTVLEMALPVSTALGAALATSRLARDNELTVLRGTGTPLARIFLPFLVLGCLLAGAGLYTANVLQPRAAQAQLHANQGTSGGIARSEGVLLTRAGERSEWLVQLAAERVFEESRHLMDHLCLIEQRSDQTVRILLAPSAEYNSNTGRWILQKGVEHRYSAQGARLSEQAFPSKELTLKVDLSREFRFWDLNQQTRFSFFELTRAAQEARLRGDTKKALELETGRWFKLALSSMCLVFALCAPPLVLRFSKAGSFAGVLLSVILVFVGWNTVLLMKSIALSGWVPPVVCAFSTHALFLIVGLFLLARSD